MKKAIMTLEFNHDGDGAFLWESDEDGELSVEVQTIEEALDIEAVTELRRFLQKCEKRMKAAGQ